MKTNVMRLIGLIACFSLLASCGAKSFTCTDTLGCIEIKPEETIKIGLAVTLTGPDSVTGIDTTRGVEIAISHHGSVLEHEIELVKEDERCEEAGGIEAATRLSANPQIVAVIGASCSSAGVPAAKILSDAGMVMISPSTTAPSLTGLVTHQPGFLRTIYNDKAQGKFLAEFAYTALGVRRIATIHDGTYYSKELQEVVCEVFTQLGGACVAQVKIDFVNDDILASLQMIQATNPDALYYPLYNEDGIRVTQNIVAAGLENAILISSDSLLNDEFFTTTTNLSEGMYFSGPSMHEIDPSFLLEYRTRYGEDPIDVFHAQAYDAAIMIFLAIEKVAIQFSNGTLYIPRQALREALFATKGMQGLSGEITCSPDGDCAHPAIQIYQKRAGESVPVYP